LPAAALLRHQAALQLVGQPRHGAGEAFELLVEDAAQLVELLGRAELARLDDLVELLGEGLVAELVGELVRNGAGRWRVGRILAGLARLLFVGLVEIGFRALDIAGLFGLARGLVLVGLGVLALAFALFGIFLVVLAALGFLVVTLFAVLALAVVEVAVGDERQVAQQLPGGAAEQVLVLELAQETGQRIAGLFLDLLAPQVHQCVARGRDRDASDTLAQDEAERLRDRRIGL